MVNHVVPRGRAATPFTHGAWPARIAQRPSFALKLAKESVNQTLEAQGQCTRRCAPPSRIQHLAHAHNRIRFGIPVDPGPSARDGR